MANGTVEAMPLHVPREVSEAVRAAQAYASCFCPGGIVSLRHRDALTEKVGVKCYHYRAGLRADMGGACMATWLPCAPEQAALL